jgi:hypothetical protein
MRFLSTILIFIERAFYRIEGKLKPSPERVPWREKDIVDFPAIRADISVELALNSRCSSDYDGNPRKFHWGMFEESKRLSENSIRRIVELVKIPRFTQRNLRIKSEENVLFFIIDDLPKGLEKDWALVESGMQQQAMELVCSALGVGISLKSLGKDGTSISENEYAAVKAWIDAMKPSYDGSYWSPMVPNGRQSWVPGNLPEPVRNSVSSFFTLLPTLEIENEGTHRINRILLSQILWAARGRTPHLYKTRPWGLTIPTWGGLQGITGVYIIHEDVLSMYSNWERSRPTHSLQKSAEIPTNLRYLLSESFEQKDTFIVLNRTDDHARSFWEVGYQLFYILIQAKALDLHYQASLLNEEKRETVEDTGIRNPVAIVAL